MMFNDLLERLKSRQYIEEQLSILLEKKTWEEIALGLYQILDDMDTASDVCKENLQAFQNMVLKKQQEKNKYLYSPDGYKIERVDGEPVEDSKIESPCMLYNISEPLDEGTVDHAQRELELAGLFDKDSDYDGMLGEAVIELMKVFASQDHSGMSAAMTRELFSKLSNFEQLTELTDREDEWMDVAEASYGVKGVEDHPPMHQSRRNPACFSNDKGKTYYNLDDKETMITSKHIDEWIEPSQEQLDEVSQEMFNKDYDKLPVIMQKTVKDKAETRFKPGGDKSKVKEIIDV